MNAARAIETLAYLDTKIRRGPESPKSPSSDEIDVAVRIAQLAINALETGELYASMPSTAESEASWDRAREAYMKATER